MAALPEVVVRIEVGDLQRWVDAMKKDPPPRLREAVVAALTAVAASPTRVHRRSFLMPWKRG